MEKFIEPEGQTTSDNFSVSENENNFLRTQSQWGEIGAEDLSYLGKKGMKTPADLLKSYRALEKAFSTKISLPKDGDQEGFHKLYSHLGMPENKEQFEIKMGEADLPFLDDFKQVCLDNNILPKSAQGLYDWFVKNRGNQITQSQDEWLKKSQNEMEEVKQTWGAQTERNLELMKRGIRLFSYDDENDVAAIEQALGTKKMMSVFLKLGEAIAEDNPVSFGQAQKGKRGFDMVEYFREMFNDY